MYLNVLDNVFPSLILWCKYITILSLVTTFYSEINILGITTLLKSIC